MHKFLAFLFAALLLASSTMHLSNPDFYTPFLPRFMPQPLINYLAAAVEIPIAIALILPAYRKWGGLAFAFLMLVFLPLHVWDVVRDSPALGSRMLSIVRLLFQFFFIYAGWRMYNDRQQK